MYETDLTTIREVCSFDTYVYLYFLRTSAVFFGVVSFVTCSSLIPTYIMLGGENDDDYYRKVYDTTLLNVDNNPKAMWTMLIVSLLVAMLSTL